MFWRAITLIIAGLLAALGGAVYWFALRPLPQTAGEMAAPISADGAIWRDARGVPHIQAATVDDALFLQGYAMAQDRLWQMDGLRRRAAGELAEIVGAIALKSDEDARQLGVARIAAVQEANLSPEDLKVMQAFTRGVNYFIETHRNRLPLEFTLLRYQPKPWRVRDSMLAGMEMYRTLTTSWPREVLKQQMLAEGEPAKVEFLLPARASVDHQPGSNAWVVAGAHTATGKPILANDPHLEYSLPSPWYLSHLETPDLDVTGATIVGLPGVVTGHNHNIAWGVTNLEFDVQDLYRTTLNESDGRYVLDGKVFAARKEQETIAVKRAAPVTLVSWVTQNGSPLLRLNGQWMVLRWSAQEQGGFTYPFLELDRAHNWEEFRAALRRFGGPGQNFVYADTAGNIGYQATGHLPRRKGCAGDVPASGTKDTCAWDGMLSFDELPRAYNPPSGRIATANQDPFPQNSAYTVHGYFAPTYRARQIYARLAAREKWQAEEMLDVETDAYSEFGAVLAKQIVGAWDRKKDPSTQLAAEILRMWDGQMDRDQAAPAILMRTLGQLREAIANRAVAGKGRQYADAFSTTVIAKLLTERPGGWFTDYDSLLLAALGKAVGNDNVALWRWGQQQQQLEIVNPVMGRLPVIGQFFNLGPLPMNGSPTSVLQYTGRLGPSLRMITDLANLDHSFANLATGESGQIFSPHYADQWDAYYNARSFPMEFGKVEAKEVLRVAPENPTQ